MKHDCDANRSPKLEKLLMVHGLAGFGLYWLIVELIGDPIDKDNISFKLKHDTSLLAYRGKVDESQVIKMIDWMVEEHLLERHPTTGDVTCLKLAERIDTSLVRNPQLKVIQTLIRTEVLCHSEQLGMIQNDSEGLLLEVDLDLDLDSDKNSSTTTMYEDWSPSESCATELVEAGTGLVFIDDYMPGFKRYWIDSGKAKVSWDAVFYEQCLAQYHYQNNK